MTEPGYEDLLNREIDGANGPEESAALRTLIGARPEAKARYDALLGLSQMLASVKSVEPPPGLSGAILRSVREKARAVPREKSWLEVIRHAFGTRPVLAYACTFAGGLALGAFLSDQSSLLSRPDRSGISGTMLPEGRLGTLETVDRQPFATGSLRGEATTKLGGDRVLAEIQIQSERAVDVTVEFDGNSLTLLGFQQSGSSGSDIALGAREIRLRHVGEGRYQVSWSVRTLKGAPLRLRISGDNFAVEKALATRREGS